MHCSDWLKGIGVSRMSAFHVWWTGRDWHCHEPVMCVVMPAGDRKGAVMCWNVATASRGWGVKDSHIGHITALAWQQDKQQGHNSSGDVALSGGQDGFLRVWDGRSGGCIAQQPLHVDARGKGAIGAIVTGGWSDHSAVQGHGST